LAGIKDQMLEPASEDLINQDLAFPTLVYAGKKSSENLKTVSSYTDLGSLVDWGFQ
jgi:hypothetical protein